MPPVIVTHGQTVFPTYEPAPADKNPMFLEKRVFQGSSGSVYPLPFIDRIATKPVERAWESIELENEYVSLMILPEIGGRIHIGLDKTNGYDFFYRQHVIKPALVGLAGPWISGGVEFNWPQHHRPSTYMPCDAFIERHDDGAVTVWLSEHEPISRMKGMHGVCLRPGSAVIELKARLYNRTPMTQTFLWWSNVAARVHERYQSFFPPDVYYVADHAKRAMSEYPLCKDHYYGVDFGKRGKHGVPPEEAPANCVPPDDYAPNDISWYANLPVPCSYMAMGSREDFFGGYDHDREAGFIHYANHHISPGKKQWTWGNHEFGYAWDRNLTGADGPYIELMAGVYTDNQPDFSFLTPGETKIFSQYWYPIQKIGVAQQANLDAAVHLKDGRLGVAATQARAGARIVLRDGAKTLIDECADLDLNQPYLADYKTKGDSKLSLAVFDADGTELIRYEPRPIEKGEVPPAAFEPDAPAEIGSIEELYLTGLHLEQYRHATRRPELYWKEGLRRDPGDSRCHNRLGLWRLRRGEFTKAEEHFRTSIARQTRLNPNPIDGEVYYNLGLTLRFQGRVDEAFDAFSKAVWDQAWVAAGHHALAEIEARRGHWEQALEHLDFSLRFNTDNLRARDLKAVTLWRLGCAHEAEQLLHETLELDPLDHWASMLLGQEHWCDNRTRFDLASDCVRAGLHADALEILKGCDENANDGSAPLIYYYRACCLEALGRKKEAAAHRRRAARTHSDYCFPARIEEMLMLEAAIEANPKDARAPFYLGCLLYDKRRHEEAIKYWELAVKLEPRNAVAWRCLGIGYFNVTGKPAKAKQAYEKAIEANPKDARLIYERDQLWKRLGVAPARRLREIEKNPNLAARRDDLSVELATLYNQTGQPHKAQKLLASHRFQPWEGGEGMALGQHARTHLMLGRRALETGNVSGARMFFEAALKAPENLGEAWHLLVNQSDIHFWLGEACQADGDKKEARRHWTHAAEFRGDFQLMEVRRFSEMTYYSALALRRLGRGDEAKQLLNDLLAYARELEAAEAKIDYFATSLPAMLLFNDDIQARQVTQAMFLKAQASLGLGRKAQARKLLAKVLERDANHPGAADLREE